MAKLNHFAVGNSEEEPQQEFWYEKLADGATLFQRKMVVKGTMKARAGNTTYEAKKEKKYLEEGPKQIFFILIGLAALKAMGLANRSFFPSD